MIPSPTQINWLKTISAKSRMALMWDYHTRQEWVEQLATVVEKTDADGQDQLLHLLEAYSFEVDVLLTEIAYRSTADC